MNYWKEHASLRVTLIGLFFIIGLVMVVGGWKMTGKMTGLVLMLIGLVLLLAALLIYNKGFD
ncbi:MAG: hypothetical protein HFI26_11060 [Lachnospiraceae bacterium]|jgi:peptidoglycan/LPS O-acetylase OafA/YrhL|nr:hypothetical protein [Lachnospiraceae bacterium]